MLLPVVGHIGWAFETKPENFSLTPATNPLSNKCGLRKLTSGSPVV
jgi:hypothetical protein